MCNCNSCLHGRVCGLKEKYQQYIEEFNELNEKWDIFERNPNCPEFTDKSLLRISQGGNWFEDQFKTKDIDTTYNNKTNMKPRNIINSSKTNEADYAYMPIIVSLNGQDKVLTVEDILNEIKRMKY